MISIAKKENCSGCTACKSICPNDAIEMKPDTLGFLYPEVNADLCSNCGLCNKVCSFNKDYDKSNNFALPEVYAVRCKAIVDVEKSQSGGAFVAISDYILSKKGVVYGVGYKDYFRVVHKRATTTNERDEFRGSKYVQSDLNDTYTKISLDLKKGLDVLFTGTPCQTSGLISYLSLKKVDTNKLITCDLICHGVPSPYFWRDYIEFLAKKYKKRIESINFRDKAKTGWNRAIESYKFGETKVYRYNYLFAFFKCIMHRDSCAICHYTNFQRPSDITIGDYWGWEKIIPNFSIDNKGISLVIINTSKGRDIFESITNKIIYQKTSVNDCLQSSLQRPTILNKKSKAFQLDYETYGFLFVSKKYRIIGLHYHIERLRVKCILLVKRLLKIK